MKNRIKGMIDVEWESLKPIQPEDAKIKNNIEALKTSLKTHGFSVPFAVWKSGGKLYTIDGHTRRKALQELKDEGNDVPEILKGYEVDAKDRKEAVKILVEVFNQKHNAFDNDILVKWLEVEEVEIENMESVHIGVKFHDDDFDIEDFFEDNEDEESEDLKTKQIILNYTEEDYEKVIEAFNKHGRESKEDVVFKLLCK